jgi:hypothetical protein
LPDQRALRESDAMSGRKTRAFRLVVAVGIASVFGTWGRRSVAQETDGGHHHGTQSAAGHHSIASPTADGASREICRLFDWKPSGAKFGPEARRMLPPASSHVRVIDRATARELAIEVGPVDLPAHSGHREVPPDPEALTYLPFDAVVTGYRLELVDAQGRPVPREVLHHMDTRRPALRELFLPVTQRFLALSTDTPEKSYPGWLIGAPIYGDEPLLVTAMFHNASDVTYRGVRARMVLRYTRRRPLLEVMPFHLDVAFPMGRKSFDLPPGRSVWTWEGSPAVGGRVIGIGGHVHRYAQRLEFRDVTDNRVIWDYEPRDDGSGEMPETPAGLLRLGLGVRLDPAHRYRITAVYDNPTGRTIAEGVMAKVAGVLVPAGGHWPSVDPSLPLYRADLNFSVGGQCSDRLSGHAAQGVSALDATGGRLDH